MKSLLNDTDIVSLLNQEPITDEWPWNSRNEAIVHGNIKDIIAEIRRKSRLLDKTEFGHYGSGYASFVDCWLYREVDAFRFHTGNCYWGLLVLFSSLSKYFVVGEGQKTWNERGGSSYLPSFRLVDQLTHPAVRQIENGVSNLLASRGLIRLHVDDLSTPLARDIEVPTILDDRPWRHFDALFHWED